MIEVRELCRQYGELKAVQDVSFDIGHGEIVGLLGHNGAGKTTIMKMLTGYLEPSAGTIRVDGLDIAKQRRAIQRRIGYLPENCPLYPEMTVLDYLDYQASLHGLAPPRRATAIRRAVERTELGAKATAIIGTLSRGYRQRVGVAQAILHEPVILILDEPTNGLDPSQIQHMRGLVRELSADATLIISTHVLQEVEAVCGRVLIMRGGRLALDSRLNAIGRQPRLLVTLDRAPAEAEPLLSGVAGIAGAAMLDQDGDLRRYALETTDPRATAPAVVEAVSRQRWPLFGLETERQDLEALFGAVTLETRNLEPAEATHV
ncbi:ABC transporter ATP-binding protein [Thiocystis violascens]|uniref:ABC-type multidrug transport system, ATPase component n=1 Tax=Thiocystis violascens (strain ATCC 17096 / DSM 198 / 6111) TaxID=765911 RepID=I3Y6T9_THIV6|nr:ATP-binding cassette domain-containing protein [Thiocystis violascens]AFL72707.1 ABC-type multidrug transport system, ATPase component [Thiocystis violascens DSM 198]